MIAMVGIVEDLGETATVAPWRGSWRRQALGFRVVYGEGREQRRQG